MNKDIANGKELFRRIAQGDEAAFTVLMEQYWNVIYSQAMVWLKDTFKAQDLVQEVFLAIWANRAKLADVESPENYLFIVARNKIFNETRRQLMLPLPEAGEAPGGEKYQQPDQLLHTREVSQLLQSAINQLPPQRKRVFELSRNEGLTYEEIAGQMGISRETVKVQMVKALSFLRQAMQRYRLLFFFF